VEAQVPGGILLQSQSMQLLMAAMVVLMSSLLGGGGLAGAAMVRVPKATETPTRAVKSFIVESGSGFDSSESGVWRLTGWKAMNKVNPYILRQGNLS